MLHYGIPAQIWERLIQKHMSKLKSLQFKMNFTVDAANSTGEQLVEEILDTFRTPFWLDEHQWFVQCDWSPVSKRCYVYTVPYTFENFNIDFPIYSKSTSAPDNHPRLYEHVHRLTYAAAPKYLSKCLTLSHIQFFNIQHITIELPEHNHFRLKDQQYDPMTDDYEAKCLNQLQCLLERYSPLTSLDISEWPLAILNMPPCNAKNISVSELNLRCHPNNEYYYTRKQCEEFSRSPLGIQCKILTVDVDNPTCVRELIINMNNLQVINFRYRRVQQESSQILAEDNLVQWLRRSTCGASTGIKNIICRFVTHGNSFFIERS